jgi:N-acetylneuraminate synthase/pseudaminic acid synthase
MNGSSHVRIGKALLGPGRPAFVVAEMSGNHGGSLERALEIVRAAARAGADAVKLQTYRADTITLKSDGEDFRLPSGPWAQHASLWDLYDEAHTPWDWHEPIFQEARTLGLEVFSSPFDESAVDLLERLGAPAYKIASPEITHIPLLQKVARTGKPVIISSGVAALEDLELALATLRAAGARELVLLKCTTAYPAPPQESNLLTIPDIVKRFGVLSGLSDHSIGTAVPTAAVALGASMIEKHFMLEGGEETVDSFFSSSEQEFARLVKDIRLVEQALGRVSYEITRSALPSLRGRRSLYVSAPIRAGETLSPDNIKCVRPSFGLHPRHFQEVLGRKALRDLAAGERLRWEDIG